MDLAAFADLLDRLVSRDPQRGPIALAPPTTHLDHVADSLVGFWFGDFERCRAAAEQAAATATDVVEAVLADAVAGLAVAGGTGDPARRRWDVDAATALPDGPLEDLARYLTCESALACGRLDVATAVLDAGRPWHVRWLDHAYVVMMLATAVRTAAFAGRISEASALLPELERVGRDHSAGALAAGVVSLVTGNADRPDDSARAVAALLAEELPPVDYVGRGVHLLAAFGAVATGDVHGAAALVLVAGGPDLERLTTIDRTLALEMLIAAADADGDLDAARSWLQQVEALRDDPCAGPTAERAVARVAAMTGDAEAAVAGAERAVAVARVEGRLIEAAEGEVVLARARLLADARGPAARSLRVAVAESDAAGHHAMRRAAGDVLRRVGRRLPPVATGGWEVLSPRETEVAELILSGRDQREIASALFLSTATVRAHTSRVLAAFAVGTRVALLARLGPRGASVGPVPALTPRQSEVVALLATGSSNADIAHALGVSVKAVEKHVGDALARWGAAGRFDLALRWWRDGPGRASTP